MQYIMRNIGQRVKNYRENKGMSQEGLARAAEVSVSFIGKLERGEESAQNPTLSTLLAIAKALDTRVECLIVDRPQPPGPGDATFEERIARSVSTLPQDRQKIVEQIVLHLTSLDLEKLTLVEALSVPPASTIKGRKTTGTKKSGPRGEK